MTPEQRRQLDEDGYTALPGFLDGESLALLRGRVEELYETEGENAGAEFRKEPYARRLANLCDKGEVFLWLISRPPVLELVGHVLGPEFKLSSLNARSADPHSPEAQPLHVDAGALPDRLGYWVCNTIWLLDDFTEENGATRVVPGSHRWGRLPQNALADPRAPHPQEILVTGEAGSVVVMNTHAWHGGTANRTGRPRRALHGFYCRSDKPQQQYQARLLRDATKAGLSAELRRLLALDDPRNDRLSEAGSGASGFLK